MIKIFNFYLGILVRTRVYTNTDRMDLRVCFNFFLHFLLRLYNVSISKQHSMRRCKGQQGRESKHGTARKELDFAPRRTHAEWLRCGVKSKHGKRIFDSWVSSKVAASIRLYKQWEWAHCREISSHV